MRFYLSIQSDCGGNLGEFSAPTFEMLSEKVGAWERATDKEAVDEYDYNAQQ